MESTPEQLEIEAEVHRAALSLTVDITAERFRQNEKFAGHRGNLQHRNILTWACVLAEEAGEVVKDSLDAAHLHNKDDRAAKLKQLRYELVQTSAVVQAIIERIDAKDPALFKAEVFKK